MDGGASQPSVDPRSGFCAATGTFHSLRPTVALPPPSRPNSVTSYVFSLLSSSSSSSSSSSPTPPLPRNPAFVDASRGGASLSYPDLLSQVRALASSLRLRLGLRRGDVAFVLCPACLEVPVLYFALLSIGAVVSPSNPVSTPGEISRQIRLSGPSVAFATSRDAHKLAPSRVTTVLLDSPLFHSLLHDSPGADSPGGDGAAAVHPSDVAVIMYSSGTTGLPKAVALTHFKFIPTIAMFHGAPRREGPRSRQVTLFAVPVFHVMGFSFLLKGVALGETTVLVGRMGLPDMLRAAKEHGATQMLAAPPTVLAMSRWEGAAGSDLRALESVVCGGAALPVEVARRFEARFPWVALQQGYGTTEGGGISLSMTREECRRYGSAGRLSPNVEAKIVDHVSGEAVGVGRRGELWVRGPQIMKGYLGDNEASTTSFAPGGWLKTGDVCFFDEDGFLFIVDRLKELIKYKGYQVTFRPTKASEWRLSVTFANAGYLICEGTLPQVAPAELERLLQTHPEVVDAAVIRYPDEEAGEIPMAFVVRQEGGTLTESQVMEFVAKQVAPYKKIRKVAFINSIPRTPSGKILRRVLATQVSSPSRSRL